MRPGSFRALGEAGGGPVGVVAGLAVAGVGHHQAELVLAGRVDQHRFGRRLSVILALSKSLTPSTSTWKTTVPAVPHSSSMPTSAAKLWYPPARSTRRSTCVHAQALGVGHAVELDRPAVAGGEAAVLTSRSPGRSHWSPNRGEITHERRRPRRRARSWWWRGGRRVVVGAVVVGAVVVAVAPLVRRAPAQSAWSQAHAVAGVVTTRRSSFLPPCPPSTGLVADAPVILALSKTLDPVDEHLEDDRPPVPHSSSTPTSAAKPLVAPPGGTRRSRWRGRPALGVGQPLSGSSGRRRRPTPPLLRSRSTGP